MLKRIQILWRLIMEIFLSPRSTLPQYVLFKPELRAHSSWDKFLDNLISFILFPICVVIIKKYSSSLKSIVICFFQVYRF